jgi:hypothetical protein
LLVVLCTAALLAGCGGSDRTQSITTCRNGGSDGATASCLSPRQDASHYVEQGNKYFDTLDSYTNPLIVPAYSDLVARWEWPPWLELTGYTREIMVITDLVLKLYPTRVPERDCRAFPVQPFGRCRVNFDYSGRPCAIYEEFTFNDQGEMTFIEAWSDRPGSLPASDPADPWAEGDDVSRLATRVPGLGNATGLIDLDSTWMNDAASADPDVADFVAHARAPVRSFIQTSIESGGDLVEKGC